MQLLYHSVDVWAWRYLLVVRWASPQLLNHLLHTSCIPSTQHQSSSCSMEDPRALYNAHTHAQLWTAETYSSCVEIKNTSSSSCLGIDCIFFLLYFFQLFFLQVIDTRYKYTWTMNIWIHCSFIDDDVFFSIGRFSSPLLPGSCSWVWDWV